MPPTTYTVHPQRASAKGWQACEPHHAERWAVIAAKHFRSGKRRYQHTRVVANYSSKREAEQHQAELTRLAKPLPRRTLGSRAGAAVGKIIARSLSYDQYHANKKER